LLPQPETDAAPRAASVATGTCEPGTFCPKHDVDAGVCGELTLTTRLERVKSRANMLVVFDRSNSMNAVWGRTSKYAAAGQALLDAIRPLEDHLTLGSVLFPSVSDARAPVQLNCPAGCDPLNLAHWLPGPTGCCLDQNAPTCDVNPITSADQIAFMSAPMFAAQLPSRFPGDGRATGTPLQAAIERAAQAISSQMFSEPMAVLVLTDGEPNC
jgi:hypothetical protein